MKIYCVDCYVQQDHELDLLEHAEMSRIFLSSYDFKKVIRTITFFKNVVDSYSEIISYITCNDKSVATLRTHNGKIEIARPSEIFYSLRLAK